ncbi:MAG: hypothetical protein PW791_15420 [Neorhizobium sp.]|jgi:uncharacterized protein YjiS (DUF1127 family)|nr:hypothetical protein [Neorhizobium sp.]
MSTTEYGMKNTAAEMPVSAGNRRFTRTLTRGVKSVWRTLSNRIKANAVYELDDYQLDDIGLTRRDVTAALDRSGLLDDPSLLLSRAARERARTRFARLKRG